MIAKSPGLFYRLVSLPLLIVWLLHALKHGRAYLAMRSFGFAGSNDRPAIWVHAASVGEVEAVTPLIRACLELGEKMIVTSFTATGYQAIRRNFAGSVDCGVIPFDFYCNCRNFFRQHRIKLGLVMETELWPELLYQARRNDIPLLQINARLSQKSLSAVAPMRHILKTTLGYFSKILARSQTDRELLLQLGARDADISVLGNLKSVASDTPKPARLLEDDYILLASSHAGEELQFLQSRPAQGWDCLIVIAPRHPHRSQAIQSEMDGLGLRYAVRSADQAIDQETQVYLADTLGELKALMAHARVVVMGGSFDNTGGHNLLEPASLGCAIITGPSDSNIAADIAMLGDQQGLLQVSNMSDCWQQLQRLVAEPGLAAELARQAKKRLAQQADATSVYLAEIRNWL